MWISDNPTQNLYVMALCFGILAIAGIVHLVQQHKEDKIYKEELKKYYERQQKLYEEASKKNVIHLHKKDRE